MSWHEVSLRLFIRQQQQTPVNPYSRASQKREELVSLPDIFSSSHINSLAYAQLFLTIAQLMRRFDLTLSETTAADMEWDDCYTPKTRGHLRVTVEPLSE